MSAPLLVVLDRFNEMSSLLSKMVDEYDMKKFNELDRNFRELRSLYKLEDELNG